MSAKTVLATSRPYIRLVCQEAICCACRMEHFMEVQELIFAVHPGMTDLLRTFTLNSFVETPFAAVVLTANVLKNSAGFVPLVTFFSRTLLLHIQNYAGYLNYYDPTQLYLRCFRVNNYIRNKQHSHVERHCW